MKILLADEDPQHRLKIVEMCSKYGHEVLECINFANAINICRHHCPNLLIIDETLSGKPGEQLITQLRQLGDRAAWAMILLTVNEVTDAQLKRALKAGASYVLPKPISEIQFQFYLADAMRFQDLQNRAFSIAHDLVESSANFENMITKDAMTGVSDIHSLHDQLVKEYSKAHETHQALSLLLLDLDCFREYNATYGSVLGDRRIIEVAEALHAHLYNKSYTLARTTGEAFALLMPAADKDSAMAMAQEWCEIVDNLDIKHEGSPCSDHLTASIGVTTLLDEELEEPLEILEAADHALYYAKHSGRHKVCFENIHTHQYH